jgi:hypothetical protein
MNKYTETYLNELRHKKASTSKILSTVLKGVGQSAKPLARIDNRTTRIPRIESIFDKIRNFLGGAGHAAKGMTYGLTDLITQPYVDDYEKVIRAVNGMYAFPVEAAMHAIKSKTPLNARQYGALLGSTAPAVVTTALAAAPVAARALINQNE